MFVIALASENEKGAFSVINEFGEKVILFFEDRDDAERYILMLNDMGIDELNIVEHEEDMLIKTCKLVGFKYSKISKNDFVVPPGFYNDNF